MGGRLDELWAIALDQHGYVTSRDAADAGVPRAALVNLATRAESPQLRRVAQGVYRFSEDRIPVTDLDEYQLATLWPAGRGVLSHDTALQLHELCDVNPDRIHITVPKDYPVRRKGTDLYVIHRLDLEPDEVTRLEGIRIVTPQTAIAQGIATGTPPHLLRQAIRTARENGRADPDALTQLENRLNGEEARD